MHWRHEARLRKNPGGMDSIVRIGGSRVPCLSSTSENLSIKVHYTGLVTKIILSSLNFQFGGEDGTIHLTVQP